MKPTEGHFLLIIMATPVPAAHFLHCRLSNSNLTTPPRCVAGLLSTPMGDRALGSRVEYVYKLDGLLMNSAIPYYTIPETHKFSVKSLPVSTFQVILFPTNTEKKVNL